MGIMNNPNPITTRHKAVTVIRYQPCMRPFGGSASASRASRNPSTTGSSSAFSTSTSTARRMKIEAGQYHGRTLHMGQPVGDVEAGGLAAGALVEGVPPPKDLEEATRAAPSRPAPSRGWPPGIRGKARRASDIWPTVLRAMPGWLRSTVAASATALWLRVGARPHLGSTWCQDWEPNPDKILLLR